MPRLGASGWSTLREAALALGFDDLGTTPAMPLGEARRQAFGDGGDGTGLDAWLDAGKAGEMTYMGRTRAMRQDPRAWWPPARTAIVGLVSHDGPGEPGEAGSGESGDAPRAKLSRHAWGRDYHVVVKTMLKALGRLLEREAPGARWRLCVDRGAAMEKPLALLAGLGWIGSHGNLLRTQGSSWCFIGILLTDVDLEADEPFTADHCGTCTACVEACPTGAIVAPQVVDARRCVSYLTIELASPIPRELREPMGAWVHGCDACQDACPWNRHRTREGDRRFLPGPLGRGPRLEDLLALDEAAFTAATPRSPLKRERRRGFLRNAAVAAGNSGDRALVPRLAALLGDAEPLVRSHAAWALGRLGGRAARVALEGALGDPSPAVREEASAALERA